MKHLHHIVPKYVGGTDDRSNLIELSIEEHADAHKELFEKYGRWQDKLAYQGLSGMTSNEECMKKSMSEGGKKGGAVKNGKGHGKEGGLAAWKKHKDKITETLRENGKKYGHLGGVPVGKYMWVTDGDDNKKLLIEDGIPLGWKRGRTKKWKTGFNNTKKEVVTCPHCGSSGGKPVMVRYHFDNCNRISG